MRHYQFVDRHAKLLFYFDFSNKSVKYEKLVHFLCNYFMSRDEGYSSYKYFQTVKEYLFSQSTQPPCVPDRTHKKRTNYEVYASTVKK